MESEKWNYKGEEIDIPVVGFEDIERPIVNFDDTMELPLDIINDDLEDTLEISLENGENYE